MTDKTPNCVSLVIPQVPLSLNQWNRYHWRKLHAYVENWADLVAFEVIRLPYEFRTKVLPFRYAVVRVNYTFSDRRRRDHDNYVPKQILDGLQRAGVIVDDASERCISSWTLRVDRKLGPSTEIVVLKTTAEEVKQALSGRVFR